MAKVGVWITRDESDDSVWGDVAVWNCNRDDLMLCDDGYWAHYQDDSWLFICRYAQFRDAFGIKLRRGKIRRAQIRMEML